VVVFPYNTKISQKIQPLATSGRLNYATIIDRQKFITKWALYGMSSFYFYRWNQFKVIPLASRMRTRNVPVPPKSSTTCIRRPLTKLKTA